MLARATKSSKRQGILIASRSASGFCETVLSRPRWTGSLCPRRAPGSIFTYPTSLTPVMSCPLNLSVRVMGFSFSFSASVFPYMSDAYVSPGLAGRQPFTSLSPQLFANCRSSAASNLRCPTNLASVNTPATTGQTKSSSPSSWRPRIGR